MKLLCFVILAFCLPVAPAFAQSAKTGSTELAPAVEALFAPGRDLLDVKLTVDSMVDPSANAQAVEAEIARMADAIRIMAGETARSAEKLTALKRYLYEGGDWNGKSRFNTTSMIRSARSRQIACCNAI